MAGSLPPSGVALIAQNAGKFLGDMKGAQGALGAFGSGASSMSNIVTGAFRQVGAIITNVAAQAIRAVGEWVGESLSVAGDFQETLNILGATSGATAAQLDQVAAKAKELGADLDLPTTSANDAAEVMLELSKAGLSVQESMDAAKGALLLAAAADTDSATATGILTGALNAFGLEATEAVRIADLLAAGANASSASMTDLGQGLQQAGAIMHAAGVPVEDLITSLAALTNVGYTGSDAGTALKNAMTRLINPTDKAAKLMDKIGFSAYDAQGKMKPFPVIIDELNKAFVGMTDEQKNAALSTIFLSDGMKAMIPLLALGEDGFLKLKDQVTEQGAAADVASARMQGWNGALAGAKSQLENIQLAIGQLLINYLTPFVQKAGEILGVINGMIDKFQRLAPSIAASDTPVRTFLNALMIINPSLIGLVGLLFQVYDKFLPLVTLFQNGGASGMAMASALQAILGPLGLTSESANAAAWAIQRIWDAAQKVAAVLMGTLPGAATTAQGALQAALGTVVNFVLGTLLPVVAEVARAFAENLPAAINVLSGVFTTAQTLIGGALGAIWSTVQTIFGTLQTYIPAVMYALQSIIGAVLTQVTAFWNAHGTQIMTFVQSTWSTISTIINTALQIILSVVIAVLQAAADFINQHGQAIQTILSGAWDVISNVITAALALIQGVLQTVLSIMQGDWQGAWTAIQTMSVTFVKSIGSAIMGFLNMIAGFFGTSLEGIKATWSHNWDAMVSLFESIPGRVAGVGGAIVRAIANGFASAWESFMATVRAKLDALKSMLPFSEPKDKSSPLFGLPKSGKAIVAMLQAGIDAAPPLTIGRPVIGALPAKQMHMGGGHTTNNTNTRNINMPVYTNQSPSVISQGLALAEAVSR